MDKQNMVRALIGVEQQPQQPHGMTKEEWHESLRYLYKTVASVASAVDQVIDKNKISTEEQWNEWLEYLYLGYPTIASEVDRALMNREPSLVCMIGDTHWLESVAIAFRMAAKIIPWEETSLNGVADDIIHLVVSRYERGQTEPEEIFKGTSIEALVCSNGKGEKYA